MCCGVDAARKAFAEEEKAWDWAEEKIGVGRKVKAMFDGNMTSEDTYVVSVATYEPGLSNTCPGFSALCSDEKALAPTFVLYMAFCLRFSALNSSTA